MAQRRAGKLVLVTGGARSGKSRFALDRARRAENGSPTWRRPVRGIRKWKHGSPVTGRKEETGGS